MIPWAWAVARAAPALLAPCGDDRACVAAALERGWTEAHRAVGDGPSAPAPAPTTPVEQGFVDACDDALARFPEDPAAGTWLARAAEVELSRGRLGPAAVRLERALALPDGPHTERAGMLLLDVHNLGGDWAALAATARALAGRPVVGPAVRRDLAAIEAAARYKLADTGDPADPATAAAYLAVADGFPTSDLAPNALRNAARVLDRSGDAAGALEVRLRLVALDPGPDQVTAGLDRMDLAFACERLGRTEEAATWFEAAAGLLQRAPGREREAQDALYDAALLRDRLGQRDAALRLYRRYLQTWPAAADAERVRARIRELGAPPDR